MSIDLENRRIVIVGGGSGIAAALAAAAVAAGAEVVLAGRDPERLEKLSGTLGAAASTVRIDLADEQTIIDAAERVGAVDHVVSLASAPANGPVGGLDRADVAAAFDAKVVGPLLLAKHFAPAMRPDGSFLFFSGVAAWRPAAGLAVMATTNGAVSFLAEALAVELAPVRVNALSPGIIDSGAWDRMGDDKAAFFERTSAANPAGRVGTPDDVARATIGLLTSSFVTGTTLHVDGGGRLA